MRRQVHAVALATIGALGALAGGCLLTTTLDGLSGGATPAEGGSEAAAGDSSTDSGKATDAASTDGEAGPPDFRCAMLSPTPAFCTDFDVGTLDSIIDSDTAAGGTATLDDKLFLSTHRSLRLATPKLLTGIGHAVVSRRFGFVPQSSIVVQLDLHVDSIDKSASNLLSIDMGGYDLSLFVAGTAKIRQGVPGDGGLVYSATDRVAPAAGKWVHLAFNVSIKDDASSVVLSYDGVAQSPLPLVIDRYRATGWTVSVGLNFVGAPDDGRDVHIDNLVIEAR